MSKAIPAKPLGGKNYGSIPHLPGSRLGPGDHHCHPGQAAICTERLRDKHDRVIVSEKVDGSNVGVARLEDGRVVALGRSGYLAQTSTYEQHQLFAFWVREREQEFAALLEHGERFVGEWLAQAHGTRYAVQEPFVVFDLMRGPWRAPYDALTDRLALAVYRIPLPRLLHDGGPIGIECALDRLERKDHWAYEALDPQEGVVYRVERAGAFDFMAKFVKPDKIDGKYLPEMSGQPAVWNWRPKRTRTR